MTHLKPAEIIDAAEGHGSPERDEHLQACARCRNQVQDAATVLHEVKMVPAPEPSPLFWGHLSANIRRITSRERPAASSISLAWIWGPATAIAAAVAVVIGVSNIHVTERSDRRIPTAPAPAEPSAELAADDGSWSLVSEVSEDLGWEEAEAAGLAVRPGAAERAAADLSEEQREELARLLQQELARSKS